MKMCVLNFEPIKSRTKAKNNKFPAIEKFKHFVIFVDSVLLLIVSTLFYIFLLCIYSIDIEIDL